VLGTIPLFLSWLTLSGSVAFSNRTLSEVWLMAAALWEGV